MKTIVGLFDSVNEAQAARADLLGSGIEHDRISIVTRPAGDVVFPVDRTEAAEGAGIGATAGAFAGGAAGLLASLVIPGVGPLLAAGSIVAILTGAGIGAAAGGAIGSLVGLGIPHAQAEAYAEGIDRGGTLLTIDSTDNDADRIAAVLSQHHAVDIEKRALEWENSGWQRQYPRETSAEDAEVETQATINPKTRGIDKPAEPSPTRTSGSKPKVQK